MYLFKRKTDLKKHLDLVRKNNKSIGFVPTMGALHQGHLSLIQSAKKDTDVVVCSIFVNPTQFNDPKDFEKYPITVDEDIKKLNTVSTDILFLPAVDEMYPEGLTAKHQHYDFGDLENVLEGEFRPGHFQGVGIIVHKLLDIVQPDQLFMGQKDLQQCLIIKKLLHIMQSDTRLVVCPTMREADGLAMSSRNTRLSPEARKKAPAIYQALKHIRDQFGNGLLFMEGAHEAFDSLKKQGFEPEYVDILLVENSNIKKLDHPPAENDTVVAAIAAWLDGVRLIDNIIIQGNL
ncbi:pantoate--beta-alanine ligase [Chitinophaga terrae (ex Kim and Jung 2007)]|uniref:Pantothenate synthetase n=1 Tax=Chitinophaga terrae (ex Kim and Jung 2007) TaxID=408074 RepID=A0A1H4CD43_9BACT|nr:pantoate--beta-alanine ligase [Chitinophaga terrae (ex Kim and Jung 2007)]GEP88903.1 pantothenate synthetase [Chitinophaga terrae (ex Kim and Jung 2007)]SEA58296.1 pantoate--beta-alanine ligase [Chitinophaga terrae (ex Kim and Jung 2007)]